MTVKDMNAQPDLPTLEKLTLRGYTLDVDRFLKANYDDIAVASGELPAVMEWVNECLHDLREQYNFLKIEVDEVEAKSYFELTTPGPRGLLENYNTPSGKATAEALSLAVTLDKPVGEKKRELAKVAAWCQRLAGLQQSLQAKLDLVRSTESTRRAVFGPEGGS
jgi:hypothetical protein